MSGKKRSRSGPEKHRANAVRSAGTRASTFCRATYATPMHSPTMPAPGFCEEKNSKMAGPTQRVVRGRRFLAGTTDPIEKSTSVTVACRPVAALFSLASLISAMPGAPRTVGTVLRATLSSPARTRTTATRFTLNVKSSIRIPARSERTPPQECETLTLRSLALKLMLDILDASSVFGLSEPKTWLRPLHSIKCAHAFVQNRGGQFASVALH